MKLKTFFERGVKTSTLKLFWFIYIDLLIKRNEMDEKQKIKATICHCTDCRRSATENMF